MVKVRTVCTEPRGCAQLFRLPCVGAARGGSCVVRGLGDRGVRRRVEGDPDCGMSPVHPMPDMPFPDLIACLKGGEARCEATYAEYSAPDRKGHDTLDRIERVVFLFG